MKLESVNLSCGYGKKIIMQNVSFSMGQGEVVCLLGSNGAGKTTFFRTLLGLMRPLGGAVFIDGADITGMKPSQLAARIAYVPQSANVSFPFSVEEVVLMGRGAHVKSISGPSLKDQKKARECMASLGIAHLGQKVFNRLSGGERQMVLIARALTQQTAFLVLDEPTSNLDFGNQIRILERILELKERGIGIIMTTHSPDQVLLCASRVMVFNRGALVQIGTPQKVITASLLQNLYGVNAMIKVMQHDTNRPVRVCIPCLRHPTQAVSLIKEEAV